MPDSDDIIIRRKLIENEAESDTEENTGKPSRKKKKIKTEVEIEKSHNIQTKAFAVLMYVFSIMLFLALASYTSRDEANTAFSLKELGGLFSSDSAIRIKADTTHNWLGLFGAVLADWFYNGTIGYIMIFLPFFIFKWAKQLFSKKEISISLIKKTTVFFIVGTLFACLCAAFHHLFGLPKEWSGAVGLFLNSIVSSLTGNIGSLLIFSALFAVAVITGTNISINRLSEGAQDKVLNLRNKLSSIFDYFSSKKEKYAASNIDKKEAEVSYSNAEEVQIKPAEYEEEIKPAVPIQQDNYVVSVSADSVEPARIIKPAAPVNSTRTKQVIKPEPESFMPKGLNIKLKKPDEDKVFVSFDAHNLDEHVTETPILIINDQFEKETVVPDFKIGKPEFTNTANQTANNLIEPVNNIESANNITETVSDEYADKTAFEEVFPKNEIIEEQPEEIQTETPYKKEELIEEAAKVQFAKIIPPAPVKIMPQPVPQNFVEEKKPLVVTVNEREPEPVLNSTLSLAIHDETISYISPGSDLLVYSDDQSNVDEEELKMNARILQEKLETFKIYIEDLAVTPGPVVTQYEFVPAAGIKISKIESLADDLAMALKARGIRIIAPIPGKGTVGIEIPNLKPSLVRFSNIVNTQKFQSTDAILPMALGKNISGEVVIADMTKMPHLLIAGSTGSGKSVGINTIISSLLYKMHPSKLKFVIIDPKKVELQQYARLKNHFMASSPEVNDTIVTNPQDAVTVLKSVVVEMENRYNILAKVGQRNIKDYNEKVASGTYKDITEMDHRQMPYIVVVIDELADLMLTASKEVEEPIIRLAQMARAVGIHLIIATQRPSVDVITGIIKANFPARIAYLVASKIDSRTILDGSGAEQLLGNGDMLFLPSGQPKPTRLQNAFISTDEVDNLCDHIGNQKGYSQPYILPAISDNKGGLDMIDASDRDQLFNDAARLVVNLQQASVSLIQRRLKVGYARAGRIVDELEAAGVVGPFDGSKARIVLLDSLSDLEYII